MSGTVRAGNSGEVHSLLWTLIQRSEQRAANCALQCC